MEKRIQKFIVKQGLIVLATLILAGCFAPNPPSLPKKYKEFEMRRTRTVNIKPKSSVTAIFEVYDVDDYVNWFVAQIPVDVKLIDPKGNSHSWIRTCGPGEGWGTDFYFYVQDPIPGDWRMVFTSKSWKQEDTSIFMHAWSDKEGAYKK